MKHRDMLPYRRLALLAAISSVAPTFAQQWGGGSQEYCSNQNTGSDYSSVSDSANSFQACSNTCSDGYAFAIVQWENCWCSNYIPADQGDTSDCNQSCPGYPDDKCGNQDQGLYGYVALGPSPSGTAGGGSSSQASSTSAASSTSERVSTSTTSTSSRRERTSSSPPTSFSSSTPDSSTFTSSSSSDSPSESSSPRTSTRTSPLTTSSQTSSSEATTTSSSSRRPSTSSSDPPTTSSSSSRTPTTSSTSSTPPPETSSSSSTIVEAPVMTSDSSSSIPESATPSPVTSTRVVTISGEPVTETVTSTPMVAPDRQSAETDSSSSSSLSGGAIAGVVIGVLAFLALLALAIFLLWRRKRQDPNNPQHGYPEMSSQGASRRPRRNVSVLSKVGLLSRGHETTEDDNNGEPSSAGAGASSARHSAFFPTGSSHSHGPEASSPLGPQSQNSGSLYQMDSRRHSKPFVYDQRLNPSALFANAEANGSRISMADNTDYSRPLDGLGGGKLQVRNPDPRASFESRA